MKFYNIGILLVLLIINGKAEDSLKPKNIFNNSEIFSFVVNGRRRLRVSFLVLLESYI